MKTDNKKAIVVYLDNSNKMEQELTWLHKTWLLYSLDEEFDLVVYHHPDAASRISRFDRVIPIEMPYIRMAYNYKFLNSHYFCSEPYNEPLKKYKYLLKTDCDVFLTENIKNFTPNRFLIGQGDYYNHSEAKQKTSEIMALSEKLSLGYKGFALVGASFFGTTKHVLYSTSLQASITEFLLTSYFDDNKKIFDRGIASMIAGDISINHIFAAQHISLYSLDEKCWDTTKIGKNVIHIHAWHTNEIWSKHKYFEGKYADWKVSLDDAFSNAANYCHWIATTSYYEIMLLRHRLKTGDFKPDYKLLE